MNKANIDYKIAPGDITVTGVTKVHYDDDVHYFKVIRLALSV